VVVTTPQPTVTPAPSSKGSPVEARGASPSRVKAGSTNSGVIWPILGGAVGAIAIVGVASLILVRRRLQRRRRRRSNNG